MTFTGDDGNLVIETGSSRFRIRGEDPEGFVDLPYFPEKEALSIEAPTLRNMIRRTVFATAKEAGRYALHGVLFRVAEGQLELVATDADWHVPPRTCTRRPRDGT